MFTADAKLDLRSGRPASLNCQRDQLPNTVNIEADKRVAGKDALVDIGAEEAPGIIPRKTQSSLG